MKTFSLPGLWALLVLVAACGSDAVDTQGSTAGGASGEQGAAGSKGGGSQGGSGGSAGENAAGGSAGAAGNASGGQGGAAGQGGSAASGSAGAAGGAGDGGSGGAGAGGGGAGQGGSGAGGSGGAGAADTLDANRDRLLATYFDYLKASAAAPQSNGLSGGNVGSVCDVWSKLDPSSRSVFLSITARMQGSRLGSDGSSMLGHITRVYRVVGGEGATSADPGSCGGGEFNRMIMSMDSALHAALIAASDHKGAAQAGKYDIADAPPKGTFWRDSHDLGGTHSPFDASDETDQGAPRGQTQYFRDLTSTAANSPLGRTDLTSLVDPYTIEMDMDYDCVHSSNPLCSYITYGTFCAPKSSKTGAQLCAESYGDYNPGWKPSGCP